MNKQKLAACLMLFSGISHPTQLLIYGTSDPTLVNSSLMGTSFLFVGAMLLTGRRWALWVGAIQPLIFGIGACYRIATEDVTPFSYLHTVIDFVVVALCIIALKNSSEKNSPDV
jgi:hypothetical protein